MKPLIVILALLLNSIPGLLAQSVPFTYQGRLVEAGAPANGLYQMRFAVWNAATGGEPVSGVLGPCDVPVANGLFTEHLSFPNAALVWNGEARWLEIEVRKAGSADTNFVRLNPRQPVTASPYALLALNASSASTVAANAVTGDSIRDFALTANKLAAGQVVKSLNGLRDDVTLTAGANISLDVVGNGLRVSSSGASDSCVDTLAELRTLNAPAPNARRCVWVARHDAGGPDGGGFFRWDGNYTPGDNDNDGTVVKPANKPGAEAGRWVRVFDGPLNVKWFGARGDDSADDAPAIQKVIDLTAHWIQNQLPTHDRLNQFIDGGVVLLPRGRYVLRSDSLSLPRLAYGRFVVIRGEGRDLTQIIRFPIGPVFRPDTNTLNGNDGYALIEHITLAAQSNYNVFEWNVDLPFPLARPTIHFEYVRFVSGGANRTNACVILRNGSRCRLKDCEFYGIERGVGIHLDYCGGTTLMNCRVSGSYGALLRCINSGEMLVLNCRAEGGTGMPAWDFDGAKNVTLIQAANEGYKEAVGVTENPAIFRFVNCEQIVAIEPQLATGDFDFEGMSGTNARSRFPDGMVFDHCTGCFVRGGYMGQTAFAGRGDGVSRAIRIKSNCKYVRVEGVRTESGGILEDRSDFENLGQDCLVEMSTVGGVNVSGTTFADKLYLANAPDAFARTNGLGGLLFLDQGALKFRKPDGTLWTVSLTQ